MYPVPYTSISSTSNGSSVRERSFIRRTYCGVSGTSTTGSSLSCSRTARRSGTPLIVLVSCSFSQTS